VGIWTQILTFVAIKFAATAMTGGKWQLQTFHFWESKIPHKWKVQIQCTHG